MGNTTKKGQASPSLQTDVMDEELQLLLNYFNEIPIFLPLTKKEKVKLAIAMREVKYEPGERIINQGDSGHAFYIIKHGNVLIYKQQDPSNPTSEEKLENTLYRGDYFGQEALVENTTRSASALAEGAVTLLTLDRVQFEDLLQNTLRLPSRSSVFTSSSSHFLLADEQMITMKSKQTRDIIASALENHELLTKLKNKQIQEFIEKMFKVEVLKDQTLMTQGEEGDHFYIVEDGVFDVLIEEELVTRLTVGDAFGELSLMYNMPRAATVKCESSGTVWAADRYTFKQILLKVDERKVQEYLSFLKSVNLLEALLNSERRSLAEALDEVYYDQGDFVTSQGEKGRGFYIIKSGRCGAYMHGADGPRLVQTLEERDVFGHVSLLNNETEMCSVRVESTHLTCLFLDTHSFHLLSPLQDMILRHSEQEAGRREHNIISNVPYLPKVTFKDVQRTKTILGRGAFGTVELVRLQGEPYAMKKISKGFLVHHKRVQQIMSEKQCLNMFDSGFIVKLVSQFQDKQFLYFLTELCIGGELYTVLQEQTHFDEEQTKFYSASIVIALEHIHSCGIVYRDLKPENVLLDKEGYIKLCDFGYCKIINDGLTFTMCGTREYMAPEIIKGAGHSYGCDWWALGICIYEMLDEFSPFADDDPEVTLKKILVCNLPKFPTSFSREVKQLLKGLLKPRPANRLGMGKGGPQRLRNHEWFRGFSWEDLIHRSLEAPYVPKVSGKEDTRRFHVEEEEEDPFEVYEGDHDELFDAF